MKRILIIGADSFIGRYFLNSPSSFQVEEYDILNNGIDNIDFSDVDVVFHVAAIVHQDKSISDQIYLSVNRDLAYAVALKAKAAGVHQFVFMSTVKVYGENSTVDQPWTEDSPCKPQDAYGKSKLAAEELIYTLSDNTFTVSIIRTPLVYGAGVKGNVRKIVSMLNYWPIVPLGGINNARSMVYLGNLIALVKCVIEKNYSGVILASDSERMSTSTFLSYLIQASGRKTILVRFPKIFQKAIWCVYPKLGQRLFGSLVVDSSKSYKALSFTPPFMPSQGVRDIFK